MPIVKVDDLVEQDFGFYEGKPFYARQRDSPKKSGREAHYDTHKNDPGFVDVETKDSLAKRSDRFLNSHLVPLIDSSESTADTVVVIVSHGILLSHLWRRLLLRFPPRSVVIAPDVVASRGQVVLEHLGGWSNTGFLEITVNRVAETVNLVGVHEASEARSAAAPRTPPPATSRAPSETGGVDEAAIDRDVPSLEETRDDNVPLMVVRTRLEGYVTTVLTIDGKQHLQGFKRTRGGIGRAQYDEKQKTMDSFFKRSKKE